MRSNIANIGLARLKNCITMDKASIVPDRLLGVICADTKNILDNYFDLADLEMDIYTDSDGALWVNALGKINKIKGFQVIN